MMKDLKWMVMAAALATACTGNDEKLQQVSRPGLEAIAFSAQMAPPADETRGANAMESNSDLVEAGGFGVFGCYTGLHKYIDSDVSSDFMYNQHVTYDGVNGVWNYEPIKYWPNGEGEAGESTGEARHYVSFFAYAPYSNQLPGNSAGYCIPTFHQQHELTNPWLTYRLHTEVNNQVDLLYAVPLIDRTKTSSTGREIFSFKHALACVGDYVKVSVGNELKTNCRGRVDGVTTTYIAIELKGVAVDYRLTERARLVLWTGGEANWQALSSGEALTTRTQVLKASTDLAPKLIYEYDGTDEVSDYWEDNGHGVFYIPLHRDGALQTATVTVDFDVVKTESGVTTRSERVSTATVTLSNYEEAYQPGRHLYLNMELIHE